MTVTVPVALSPWICQKTMVSCYPVAAGGSGLVFLPFSGFWISLPSSWGFFMPWFLAWYNTIFHSKWKCHYQLVEKAFPPLLLRKFNSFIGVTYCFQMNLTLNLMQSVKHYVTQRLVKLCSPLSATLNIAGSLIRCPPGTAALYGNSSWKNEGFISMGMATSAVML